MGRSEKFNSLEEYIPPLEDPYHSLGLPRLDELFALCVCAGDWSSRRHKRYRIPRSILVRVEYSISIQLQNCSIIAIVTVAIPASLKSKCSLCLVVPPLQLANTGFFLHEVFTFSVFAIQFDSDKLLPNASRCLISLCSISYAQLRHQWPLP